MIGVLDTTLSTIDRIRHDLVGLKMPRALEALDNVVRRLEKGEIAALEAIDILLSEEFTLRENSRIKTALRMGRLATIKALADSTSPSSPRSTATGSSRSPNSGSSAAAKSSTSSVRPAPERATSPSRWPSRPSRRDGASTSVRWPSSSPHWRGPSAKVACRSASASSAVQISSSWTRSATSPSSPAAATCSSSSSQYPPKEVPWSSPRTAALPNGARSSAIPSSPPRCSTGCCTTPSPAEAARRTHAGTPAVQSRHHAAGDQSAAAATRKTAEKSATLRDKLSGRIGEFYFGTFGENSRGIDSCRRRRGGTHLDLAVVDQEWLQLHKKNASGQRARSSRHQQGAARMAGQASAADAT